MAKATKNRQDKNGGIFIPAGIFLGMGFGFLVNNIPAGLFIGMGVGFALMAYTNMSKK